MVGYGILLLIEYDKGRDMLPADICSERNLAANPVCALACYGALRHLVAQLDFKLRTVEAMLTVAFGNVKLALLLVRLRVLNESGRGKEKTQF